jgi:hypothetical protein
VVAMIAGYVFGYYLVDLRRDEDRSGQPARGPAWAPRVAAAAVVVVLAIGLWMIGTPRQARRMEIDAQRVRSLEQLSLTIDTYYMVERTLPPVLDSLMTSKWATSVDARDPVTGQPYGYMVMDSIHYQLCATFDTADSTGDWPSHTRGSRFWAHDAGRHCFRLRVTSQVLPPVR